MKFGVNDLANRFHKEWQEVRIAKQTWRDGPNGKLKSIALINICTWLTGSCSNSADTQVEDH